MNQQRQRGLDLLRALSAYFVVGIHLFAMIGKLNEQTGIHLLPGAFVYATVFCAVNCFGLLSGYLGYREGSNYLKVSALLRIWLQFLFYRILFLLIPAIAGLTEEVSITDVLMPLSHRVNWYMSAYFEMMLLAPAINIVIRNSPPRINAVMCSAVVAGTAAAALARTVMDCDPFLLGEGYNWMWLAILYFLGASIKKFGWFQNCSRSKVCIIGLSAIFLTAGWRCMMSVLPAASFPGNTGKMFYSYTSPTIVIAAGAMLIWHTGLKIGSRVGAVIETMSSAALGVFIMHTTVWNLLIVPAEPFLSPLPDKMSWLNVLASAFIITMLCIPVDLVRAWFFRKLHIGDCTDWVQRKAFSLCGSLAEKIRPE